MYLPEVIGKFPSHHYNPEDECNPLREIGYFLRFSLCNCQFYHGHCDSRRDGEVHYVENETSHSLIDDGSLETRLYCPCNDECREKQDKALNVIANVRWFLHRLDEYTVSVFKGRDDVRQVIIVICHEEKINDDESQSTDDGKARPHPYALGMVRLQGFYEGWGRCYCLSFLTKSPLKFYNLKS